MNNLKKYLLNCFLLTLPVMVWNVALAGQLPPAYQPDIFWKDIPASIAYGENMSRIIVFLLAFLMPLQIETTRQKRGLLIYISGTILYFASWLALIYFPGSAWSQHILGFMAPAYTPLFWLTGIGLIGRSFYFHLPFRRWFFMAASILFLLFHNAHTLAIYYRTHPQSTPGSN